MFGKWFTDTYEGSMMGAGPIILSVWPWVMAHAGASGELTINPRLVSAHIGITIAEVEEAIDYLCKSDPNSRSEDEQGCRLVLVTGLSYRVVNHDLWRGRRNADERREYNRIKQQEARERKRQQASNNVNDGKLTVNTVSPRQKTEGEDRGQKAEQLTSELENELDENERSAGSPVPPEPDSRDEDARADPDPPLGASSQASDDVSPSAAEVAPFIPEAYEAASYLFSAIRSHKPDFCAPKKNEGEKAYNARVEKKLTGWTQHLHWLIELDEKPLEEVKRVIDYIHRSADTFNRSTVQSGQKLRKRWEELSTKAGTSAPPTRKPGEGFDYNGMRDRLDGALGKPTR